MSRFMSRDLSPFHAMKRLIAADLGMSLFDHGRERRRATAEAVINRLCVRKALREWIAKRKAAGFDSDSSRAARATSYGDSPPRPFYALPTYDTVRPKQVLPHKPVFERYAGRPAACGRTGGLRGSKATRRGRG